MLQPRLKVLAATDMSDTNDKAGKDAPRLLLGSFSVMMLPYVGIDCGCHWVPSLFQWFLPYSPCYVPKRWEHHASDGGKHSRIPKSLKSIPVRLQKAH